MYSGNEIFLHCLEQFSCGYEKLTVRTAPLMTMRVPCREYKRSSIDAVYAPCSNRAVYCLTWEYQDWQKFVSNTQQIQARIYLIYELNVPYPWFVI